LSHGALPLRNSIALGEEKPSPQDELEFLYKVFNGPLFREITCNKDVKVD